MTLARESDLDTVLDYPFNRPNSLGLAPEYADIRRSTGLARVQLPFGEQAWLATRYHDVRTVLADPRFSRAVAVDHDEPRMRAGRVTSGILSMDPPDHSRLRRGSRNRSIERAVGGEVPLLAFVVGVVAGGGGGGGCPGTCAAGAVEVDGRSVCETRPAPPAELSSV